ncbi:lipase secretion chaperone [Allohahella marinimesophila]|uniref:Lipase chaperone n=1 Tax=Allohahella marinimesophila TaxID=1054972 RepID=A0ABP7NXX5_9GAMM
MSSPDHRFVRYAVGILVIIAVVVGLGFSFQAEVQTAASSEAASAPNPPSTTVDMPSKAPVINDQAFTRPLDSDVELGPPPASLQGAAPEIVLTTDKQGNLVPERDLMTLFDFYFSAIDEEPLDRLLSRIQHALDDQLDGQALAQARDLLRRYVEYRIALGEIEETDMQVASNGMATAASLRQRFQAVAALRQGLFSSEEDDAFFQLDNVQDEYMLQRLAIEQNPGLNDQQRQQAVAALDRTLPEEIRDLRQRVTQDAALYTTTEAMRQAGAGPEQIYKVRAETLGDQAAANLAELDRQRAEWDQRLSDYSRQRNAILESDLSQAGREAALNTLIESRFTELEGQRVRALDGDL